VNITSNITKSDVSYIATHLTKEGAEQAELYGLTDVASRVHHDLILSHEMGKFTHEGRPIAVFGVNSLDHYDKLFLVITNDAITNYRPFAREARKWLSKRSQRVRCGLPRVSVRTLRMIKAWGFCEVSSTDSHVIMEYNPE